MTSRIQNSITPVGPVRRTQGGAQSGQLKPASDATTAERLACEPLSHESQSHESQSHEPHSCEPDNREGTDNNSSLADSCTLEVRFNRFGLRYHHAYIVTQDNSGADFFRGGPGRTRAERPDLGVTGLLVSGSGGAISQRMGSDQYQSSNSGNSASAGSGPGGEGQSLGYFGSVEIESGTYDSHAIDWQDGDVPSVLVSQEDGDCQAVEARLGLAAVQLQDSQIPYNPISTNSNSAAREMLERAGYPDIAAPVWAPGWRTQLR